MVVDARTLFSPHDIDLPAGNVTLDQLCRTINETFEHELQIVASRVSESYIPSGPIDPFEPDEDNSHNPRRWLLPLPSPHILHGV